jgi:hypothetical protein
VIGAVAVVIAHRPSTSPKPTPSSSSQGGAPSSTPNVGGKTAIEHPNQPKTEGTTNAQVGQSIEHDEAALASQPLTPSAAASSPAPVHPDKVPEADPLAIELPREKGAFVRDIVERNDKYLAKSIAEKAPDRHVSEETLGALFHDSVLASLIEYIDKVNDNPDPNRPIVIPGKLVLDIAEDKFPLLRWNTTVPLYGVARNPAQGYTPATVLPPLRVEAANSWLDDKALKKKAVAKSHPETDRPIKSVTLKDTANWIDTK